eukprot:7171431-Prymnesium_polylepis.1
MVVPARRIESQLADREQGALEGGAAEAPERARLAAAHAHARLHAPRDEAELAEGVAAPVVPDGRRARLL